MTQGIFERGPEEGEEDWDGGLTKRTWYLLSEFLTGSLQRPHNS